MISLKKRIKEIQDHIAWWGGHEDECEVVKQELRFLLELQTLRKKHRDDIVKLHIWYQELHDLRKAKREHDENYFCVKVTDT